MSINTSDTMLATLLLWKYDFILYNSDIYEITASERNRPLYNTILPQVRNKSTPVVGYI